MRTRNLLRRLGLCLAGIAVVLGALWFAFPALKEAPEGPADPILRLRAPVVKALRRVGILPRGIAFDDLLPSAPEFRYWSDERRDVAAEDAEEWTRERVEVEPVYRGLLWSVGERAAITMETKTAQAKGVVRIRLVATVDGKDATLAEGTSREDGPRPGTARFRVRGFVPGAASRFGYDEVRDDGSAVAGQRWSRD